MIDYRGASACLAASLARTRAVSHPIRDHVCLGFRGSVVPCSGRRHLGALPKSAVRMILKLAARADFQFAHDASQMTLHGPDAKNQA